MIPLTTEEKYITINKKYVIYVKKNSIVMIKKTINLGIIAITRVNIEVLLIIFVI